MIDILVKVWQLVVQIANDMGELWQTALLCLALSLAVTQWVKPELVHVPEPRRRRVIQLLAFAAAFIPMAALHSDTRALIVGSLVGLLSPTLYQVTIFIVHKRWPSLAAALSTDAPAYTMRDFLAGKKPEGDE